MKLRRISTIVIAAVLVFAAGAAISWITIKDRSDSADSNTLAAAPAGQNSSNPTVQMDLPEWNGAKGISDAKDIIESVTEGEIASDDNASGTPSGQSEGYFFRSFVIKFKQDMDASTLNSRNILAYINDTPAQVACNYQTESKELQIDIELNAGQNDLNTATIYVLLTKNIKTGDGKLLDSDYLFPVAN